MDNLLHKIGQCRVCAGKLPFEPRPVVQASATSRILIIGQAPGLKVQGSGIPWNDASGRELRRWLGTDESAFYDAGLFALVPMGFCYPGKGTSGDLPPRKECAPLWHRALLDYMPGLQLTLLIGKYAQDYYLGNASYGSLTENVRHFRNFMPDFIPLVHPSPRNGIWKSKNPWFETEVLPELRERVRGCLS